MELHSGVGGSVQTTLDSLDIIFGHNENFGLVLIGPRSFLGSSQTYIAHLRDSAQRTLLIITFLPGRPATSRYRGESCVLQVADASGQVLLTGSSGARLSSLRVFSCGQFLGTVDGNHGLVVLGATNELLFQSNSGYCCRPSDILCCCSCGTEVSLISNGATLACLRRSNDRFVEAEVSFSSLRNIDSRTKGLLIFSVIFLYIAEFAQISCCGRIGTRGTSKLVGWLLLAVFLGVAAWIYYNYYNFKQ